MTQQETQHGTLSDATVFRTVAPLFFLLLFAVIVSVQIYKAPFVGLANNGDFPKITGALSIGPSGPPERLAYFNGDYVYAKRFYWNVHLLLSELLPAWLATSLVRHITRQDNFDIRYLGTVHFAVLLTAVYLFLKWVWRRQAWLALTMSLLALWIFSDVSYTAYLNSFYSDTIAVLSLLLMVACALHLSDQPDGTRWQHWLLFGISSLLLITSKEQHALWALIPASVVLLLYPMYGSKRLRLSLLIVWVVLLAGVAGEIALTPVHYKGEALFSLVFSKLAFASEDPTGALRELHIPDLAQYLGMHSYSPGNPVGNHQWRQQFYERVGYAKVGKYYVRHPRVALRILRRDLAAAAEIRPHQIGNYRREDGFPPRTLSSHFASWSRLRSRLYALWPLHIMVWYLFVLACSAAVFIRRWDAASLRLAALCFALAVMAVLEYCFASLTEFVETNRHLFIFHALTDLTLCIAVATLLSSGRLAHVVSGMSRPRTEAAKAGVDDDRLQAS